MNWSEKNTQEVKEYHGKYDWVDQETYTMELISHVAHIASSRDD